MPLRSSRCGLSLRPIEPGEACRVVLLAQSSTLHPVRVQTEEKTHVLMGCAQSLDRLDSYWSAMSAFLPALHLGESQCSLRLDTEERKVRILELFTRLWRSALKSLPGNDRVLEPLVHWQGFVTERFPTLAAVLEGTPTLQEVPSEDLDQAWRYVCKAALSQRLHVRNSWQYVRPAGLFLASEDAYQALLVEETGPSSLAAFVLDSLRAAKEETCEYARDSRYFEEAFLAKLRTLHVDNAFQDFAAFDGARPILQKNWEGGLPDALATSDLAQSLADFAVLLNMKSQGLRFDPVSLYPAKK